MRGQRRGLEHAGVVDQHVDRAELRFDGVEHRAHRVGVRHVGLHREGTNAGGLQLGNQRFGRRGARGVVDGDGEPVSGEPAGDGGADAARGAGDEGDAGGQRSRSGGGVHGAIPWGW
ncbi:hypothetical protein D9M69_571870 [compost metagenome]